MRIVQRSVGIRGKVSTLFQLESSSIPRILSQDVRLVTSSQLTTRRSVSSTPYLGSYVAIDHSHAYESAMQGPHGKQLSLARLEGVGKDDPHFDPFTEEIDQLPADDDEKYGDANMVDAEYVEKDDNDHSIKDDDEDAVDAVFNPDGSRRRKKSVLATLRAGFPSGGQFAVFGLGGTQFKATIDDVLVVNRLKPVELYKIGSVHTISDVMLVGSSHLTLVGVPYVTGAQVDVMVEEITRDEKVIIFKKRRRKHSQRKNGFRRDVTLLRVLDIRMPDAYCGHKHVGRDIVDSLDKHFEMLSSSHRQDMNQQIVSMDRHEQTKLQSDSAM